MQAQDGMQAPSGLDAASVLRRQLLARTQARTRDPLAVVRAVMRLHIWGATAGTHITTGLHYAGQVGLGSVTTTQDQLLVSCVAWI